MDSNAVSREHAANLFVPVFPLLPTIPGQIRHHVFQFRVADFCLACNRHTVQTAPHHGLDQGGRKIDALFEHCRKLAFVFDGKCGSAGGSIAIMSSNAVFWERDPHVQLTMEDSRVDSAD
jgi:hypothetical protein